MMSIHQLLYITIFIFNSRCIYVWENYKWQDNWFIDLWLSMSLSYWNEAYSIYAGITSFCRSNTQISIYSTHARITSFRLSNTHILIHSMYSGITTFRRSNTKILISQCMYVKLFLVLLDLEGCNLQ